MLSTLIEKKINTPETSGAGRLFDAFASLLGLCDIATRQAEAPVVLEQCADNEFTDSYPFDTSMPEISSKPIFQGVIRDMENGVSVKSISAKIHNSLSFLILEKARSLRKETGTSKVVISGGCFQNKRLTEHLQRLFAEANIPLFVPSRIPCNDGGVSVGQLATAAAIRKKRLEQGVKD
jgi:hydrogenase maturation protein HypF